MLLQIICKTPLVRFGASASAIWISSRILVLPGGPQREEAEQRTQNDFARPLKLSDRAITGDEKREVDGAETDKQALVMSSRFY